MSALITKVKSPRVITVRGKDSSLTIGRISALTTPKITATMRTPKMSSLSAKLGKINDVTHRPTALMRMRRINLMAIS